MAADDLFFDLTRLCPLRDTVASLDPNGPPTAREIAGPDLTRVQRIGVLPGSFNPVTNAHLALADVALASGQIDVVAYLLATRTVDKERIEGASLPDRLLCLESIVSTRRRECVLVASRGLYVDLASLLRESWPNLEELWFVVGFDKIVQIFDPRYYVNIDAALDRLFNNASFLVAPRGTEGAGELAALLATPRNRRYAGQVKLLDLPEAFRSISSTQFRVAARSHQLAVGVPSIVEQFSDATGAYGAAPPVGTAAAIDAYAIRDALIDRACEGSLEAPTPDALRALWLRAIGADAEGQRLRRDLLGESQDPNRDLTTEAW